MYKRTLRTLLVAAALGVAIPVQAAVGMPTSDSSGPVVVQKFAPIVSEKLAGVTSKQMPLAQQPGQPTVREQLQEIGAWAVPSPSTTTVAASSGGGFDWNNAGIGATLFLGLVVFGAATLLTVRRHYHKPVAH